MAYTIFNAEKVIRDIKKKQERFNKQSREKKRNPKSISVGWTEKSGRYIEQEDSPLVREVVLTHEYGLGKNIDEKAFIRKTIFENNTKWQKSMDKLIKRQKISGKSDQDILEIIGEEIKKDLRSYIINIDLLDTHRLVNSILIDYHRNRRK